MAFGKRLRKEGVITDTPKEDFRICGFPQLFIRL